MNDIVEQLNELAGNEAQWSDVWETVEEATNEILRLRAENAKVRSLLRWDIVEDEEGLIICDGDHEKGEKCDHRRLYWQSTVDALRAENEKLRAAKVELLRLFDEAMDGYADCIPYKGYFLIEKHGDKENFADLRAAAAALKETGDE